ncbi:MAG: hypothetical protein DHS20C13_00110 [Thermodesulfobacteriota bacterium]|nr:MAG: hypothetical protein DHS20C13_00110 [Thermodesulfobacteriota bacterium]
MSMSEVQYPVVLFDGVCNLCNGSVEFIINRDRMGEFRFASLQSDTAKHLISELDIPNDTMDSIILVENNKQYFKSSAVLRICKKLGGLWSLLYMFILVPVSIRDYFYDIVARNRYRWFGKRENCMVPSKELESRFLN